MPPLAERLRPTTLDAYIGQRHLVAPGAVLREMIDSGHIASFILWGPPGVGKTTAARLVLEAAKKRKLSPFGPEAPFVETDGTTLRCHACGQIKKGKDRIRLSGNKAHQTDHFTYICYNKGCPLYMQKQDRDVNASKNILDKGYNALLGFASPKTKIIR